MPSWCQTKLSLNNNWMIKPVQITITQDSFWFWFISHVSRVDSLREPRTLRSGFFVCQQRMRAWNRTWASHKASCSSCRPSPPSPARCSSRWDAEAQLRARWYFTIAGFNSIKCSSRRTKTSAAECTSWNCPYSSVLSSCHTWRDRANRASGGEKESWGNGTTEWGSCSLSWTKREAKSQWWRWVLSDRALPFDTENCSDNDQLFLLLLSVCHPDRGGGITCHAEAPE